MQTNFFSRFEQALSLTTMLGRTLRLCREHEWQCEAIANLDRDQDQKAKAQHEWLISFDSCTQESGLACSFWYTA